VGTTGSPAPALGDRRSVPAPLGSAAAWPVERGDTLWQIALEVDPAADPRDTVEALLRHNGLAGPEDLHPGMSLLLPPAR
jgi:Tfp pilus assembly protein FimV